MNVTLPRDMPPLPKGPISTDAPFEASLRALDVLELATMEFKQRIPLLSPWLCSQDLCMLYAPRGVGKTHFAMSVAYAVASGGTFSKWQADRPHKVLYLDGELPGAVMQQRLLMHYPDKVPPYGYLRVFTPDLLREDQAMPDLAKPSGQKAINEMIEDDTSLVVVDNLSAWARTGRENEAESWHPVAEWILSLRRKGTAVLLVHHAGKGGQQRGTSKREDLLDVVIGLSRPKDYDPQKGAVFVAEFSKARSLRGEEAESLELELTSIDERAKWLWKTAEASKFDRVIDLTNEGLKPGEIAMELDISKFSVSRYLRKGREQGLITEHGKNR